MSTLNIFFCGEIRNMLCCYPQLIWGINIIYLELCRIHRKPIWDWQELVLIAEWSYFPAILTHCSLETPKRVIGKQNVASDQGLHCLQIVQPFFSRNI